MWDCDSTHILSKVLADGGLGGGGVGGWVENFINDDFVSSKESGLDDKRKGTLF